MQDWHYSKGSIMDSTIVELILAFEEGELSQKGTLALFSRLIESGSVWSLQGSYGRTATQLIDGGWIDGTTGRILKGVDDAE